VTSAAGTLQVVVNIETVTETRSYVAGVRLFGQRPDVTYTASNLTVLLTLFGSTADLDTLGAAPIVVGLNVADLEAGSHEVTVVPSLPSGVTVAAISPETITVTVEPIPSPTPAPTPTPTPEPSVEPSGAPSAPPSDAPSATP